MHDAFRLLSILVALVPSVARGEPDFPPISPAERALVAVPEAIAASAGAPAIVLFRRGELRFGDPFAGGQSSLEVAVRLKILNEGGGGFGEVAIAHGGGLELEGFSGRTVTREGEVMALGEADIFVEERSRAARRWITKAAFPAVTVGAVIDYRFRLTWSSPLQLAPWQVDDQIPVLLSEFRYLRPEAASVDHRWVGGGEDPEVRRERVAGGELVSLRWQNLPSILEEPYSLPLANLSRRVLVMPRWWRAPNGDRLRLLASWTDVCSGLQRGWEQSRGEALRARQLARDLADGRGARATLSALHRFVRDEIVDEGGGLGIAEGVDIDTVIADGRGSSAAKALLLTVLLEAADLPAAMVLAADWREGFPEPESIYPGGFSRVLVRAELGGESWFLDASDRRLATGRLAPVQEGTLAVVCDGEADAVELRRSPPEASVRHAELLLDLDGDGRVGGRGRLRLSGHHAWFYLGRLEGTAAAEAWRAWLAERFEGYAVSDVELRESVDEGRVDLEWTLLQHDEEVLGDETDLQLSIPLGPIRQRFTLPAGRRRTPVHLSFADIDRVDVEVRWPDGWHVDVAPRDIAHSGTAGRVDASVELDLEGRRIRYRRRFEIGHTRFAPGAEYAALRELYSAIEAHDAQSLVLVAE